MRIVVDYNRKYILRKIYEEVLNYKFKGIDTSYYDVLIPDVGYISLTGREIKDLSKRYISEYATEEEKSIYNNYVSFLKTCYETYQDIIKNPEEKDELLKEKHLNFDDYHLKGYSYKYGRLVLDINDNEIRRNLGLMGNYPKMLQELSLMDSEEEITDFLQTKFPNNRERLNQLITSIYDFLAVYYPNLTKEEQEQEKAKLKSKVRIYLDKVISERKEEREKLYKEEKKKLYESKKEEALTVIKSIIRSKTTRKRFLEENDISINDFELYKKIVKEYNPELYRLYIKRNKLLQHAAFTNYENVVKHLLYDLLAGIKVDKDTSRAFDILDYYLTYNAPLEELSRALEYKENTFVKEEYLILRRFISTGLNSKPLDLNLVYNGTQEINCRKDDNGYPIPGTGRIIQNEEKTQIIDFLNSNNIPVTTTTYRIALNRYVDNEKFIKENKRGQKRIGKM